MRPYSKKEKKQGRPYSKDEEWLNKFNITFDEFEKTLIEKIEKFCNEPDPRRLNERAKDVINYVRYVTGESRLGGWMGDKPLPALNFIPIMSKLDQICAEKNSDMKHARIKDITNYVTFASTGGKRTRKRRTTRRRTQNRRKTIKRRTTIKRRKRSTRSKRRSTIKRS